MHQTEKAGTLAGPKPAFVSRRKELESSAKPPAQPTSLAAPRSERGTHPGHPASTLHDLARNPAHSPTPLGLPGQPPVPPLQSSEFSLCNCPRQHRVGLSVPGSALKVFNVPSSPAAGPTPRGAPTGFKLSHPNPSKRVQSEANRTAGSRGGRPAPVLGRFGTQPPASKAKGLGAICITVLAEKLKTAGRCQAPRGSARGSQRSPQEALRAVLPLSICAPSNSATQAEPGAVPEDPPRESTVERGAGGRGGGEASRENDQPSSLRCRPAPSRTAVLRNASNFSPAPPPPGRRPPPRGENLAGTPQETSGTPPLRNSGTGLRQRDVPRRTLGSGEGGGGRASSPDPDPGLSGSYLQRSRRQGRRAPGPRAPLCPNAAPPPPGRRPSRPRSERAGLPGCREVRDRGAGDQPRARSAPLTFQLLWSSGASSSPPLTC
ncbi:serine/arginine repetitive matrix protein 1-like [Psammomys obesus]|uniref:serine/arginine repetitive matrix protein 1-like n=1 Tax=Psammomys obesus TaxID=48139 RepID=UPI0024536F37|nr:serine/arginine repetitive matrix protein 1-like [Psammomys obesus]